jgi:hypothetical protein
MGNATVLSWSILSRFVARVHVRMVQISNTMHSMILGGRSEITTRCRILKSTVGPISNASCNTVDRHDARLQGACAMRVTVLLLAATPFFHLGRSET